MIKAMFDIWLEVGDQLIHNLIDSITTRVNIVLKAKG